MHRRLCRLGRLFEVASGTEHQVTRPTPAGISFAGTRTGPGIVHRLLLRRPEKNTIRRPDLSGSRRRRSGAPGPRHRREGSSGVSSYPTMSAMGGPLASCPPTPPTPCPNRLRRGRHAVPPPADPERQPPWPPHLRRALGRSAATPSEPCRRCGHGPRRPDPRQRGATEGPMAAATREGVPGRACPRRRRHGATLYVTLEPSRPPGSAAALRRISWPGLPLAR